MKLRFNMLGLVALELNERWTLHLGVRLSDYDVRLSKGSFFFPAGQRDPDRDVAVHAKSAWLFGRAIDSYDGVIDYVGCGPLFLLCGFNCS